MSGMPVSEAKAEELIGADYSTKVPRSLTKEEDEAIRQIIADIHDDNVSNWQKNLTANELRYQVLHERQKRMRLRTDRAIMRDWVSELKSDSDASNVSLAQMRSDLNAVSAVNFFERKNVSCKVNFELCKVTLGLFPGGSSVASLLRLKLSKFRLELDPDFYAIFTLKGCNMDAIARADGIKTDLINLLTSTNITDTHTLLGCIYQKMINEGTIIRKSRMGGRWLPPTLLCVDKLVDLIDNEKAAKSILRDKLQIDADVKANIVAYNKALNDMTLADITMPTPSVGGFSTKSLQMNNPIEWEALCSKAKEIGLHLVDVEPFKKSVKMMKSMDHDWTKNLRLRGSETGEMDNFLKSAELCILQGTNYECAIEDSQAISNLLSELPDGLELGCKILYRGSIVEDMTQESHQYYQFILSSLADVSKTALFSIQSLKRLLVDFEDGMSVSKLGHAMPFTIRMVLRSRYERMMGAIAQDLASEYVDVSPEHYLASVDLINIINGHNLETFILDVPIRYLTSWTTAVRMNTKSLNPELLNKTCSDYHMINCPPELAGLWNTFMVSAARANIDGPVKFIRTVAQEGIRNSPITHKLRPAYQNIVNEADGPIVMIKDQANRLKGAIGQNLADEVLEGLEGNNYVYLREDQLTNPDKLISEINNSALRNVITDLIIHSPDAISVFDNTTSKVTSIIVWEVSMLTNTESDEEKLKSKLTKFGAESIAGKLAAQLNGAIRDRNSYVNLKAEQYHNKNCVIMAYGTYLGYDMYIGWVRLDSNYSKLSNQFKLPAYEKHMQRMHNIQLGVGALGDMIPQVLSVDKARAARLKNENISVMAIQKELPDVNTFCDDLEKECYGLPKSDLIKLFTGDMCEMYMKFITNQGTLDDSVKFLTHEVMKRNDDKKLTCNLSWCMSKEIAKASEKLKKCRSMYTDDGKQSEVIMPCPMIKILPEPDLEPSVDGMLPDAKYSNMFTMPTLHGLSFLCIKKGRATDKISRVSRAKLDVIKCKLSGRNMLYHNSTRSFRYRPVEGTLESQAVSSIQSAFRDILFLCDYGKRAKPDYIKMEVALTHIMQWLGLVSQSNESLYVRPDGADIVMPTPETDEVDIGLILEQLSKRDNLLDNTASPVIDHYSSKTSINQADDDWIKEEVESTVGDWEDLEEVMGSTINDLINDVEEETTSMSASRRSEDIADTVNMVFEQTFGEKSIVWFDRAKTIMVSGQSKMNFKKKAPVLSSGFKLVSTPPKRFWELRSLDYNDVFSMPSNLCLMEKIMSAVLIRAIRDIQLHRDVREAEVRLMDKMYKANTSRITDPDLVVTLHRLESASNSLMQMFFKKIICDEESTNGEQTHFTIELIQKFTEKSNDMQVSYQNAINRNLHKLREVVHRPAQLDRFMNILDLEPITEGRAINVMIGMCRRQKWLNNLFRLVSTENSRFANHKPRLSMKSVDQIINHQASLKIIREANYKDTELADECLFLLNWLWPPAADTCSAMTADTRQLIFNAMMDCDLFRESCKMSIICNTWLSNMPTGAAGPMKMSKLPWGDWLYYPNHRVREGASCPVSIISDNIMKNTLNPDRIEDKTDFEEGVSHRYNLNPGMASFMEHVPILAACALIDMVPVLKEDMPEKWWETAIWTVDFICMMCIDNNKKTSKICSALVFLDQSTQACLLDGNQIAGKVIDEPQTPTCLWLMSYLYPAILDQWSESVLVEGASGLGGGVNTFFHLSMNGRCTFAAQCWTQNADAYYQKRSNDSVESAFQVTLAEIDLMEKLWKNTADLLTLEESATYKFAMGCPINVNKINEDLIKEEINRCLAKRGVFPQFSMFTCILAGMLEDTLLSSQTSKEILANISLSKKIDSISSTRAMLIKVGGVLSDVSSIQKYMVANYFTMCDIYRRADEVGDESLKQEAVAYMQEVISYDIGSLKDKNRVLERMGLLNLSAETLANTMSGKTSLKAKIEDPTKEPSLLFNSIFSSKLNPPSHHVKSIYAITDPRVVKAILHASAAFTQNKLTNYDCGLISEDRVYDCCKIIIYIAKAVTGSSFKLTHDGESISTKDTEETVRNYISELSKEADLVFIGTILALKGGRIGASWYGELRFRFEFCITDAYASFHRIMVAMLDEGGGASAFDLDYLLIISQEPEVKKEISALIAAGHVGVVQEYQKTLISSISQMSTQLTLTHLMRKATIKGSALNLIPNPSKSMSAMKFIGLTGQLQSGKGASVLMEGLRACRNTKEMITARLAPKNQRGGTRGLDVMNFAGVSSNRPGEIVANVVCSKMIGDLIANPDQKHKVIDEAFENRDAFFRISSDQPGAREFIFEPIDHSKWGSTIQANSMSSITYAMTKSIPLSLRQHNIHQGILQQVRRRELPNTVRVESTSPLRIPRHFDEVTGDGVSMTIEAISSISTGTETTSSKRLTELYRETNPAFSGLVGATGYYKNELGTGQGIHHKKSSILAGASSHLADKCYRHMISDQCRPLLIKEMSGYISHDFNYDLTPEDERSLMESHMEAPRLYQTTRSSDDSQGNKSAIIHSGNSNLDKMAVKALILCFINMDQSIRALMNQMESAKSVRTQTFTQIYSKFSFGKNSPEAKSKSITGACVGLNGETHDKIISELFSKCQAMSVSGVAHDTLSVYYGYHVGRLMNFMPMELYGGIDISTWPIALGGIPRLTQTKISESGLGLIDRENWRTCLASNDLRAEVCERALNLVASLVNDFRKEDLMPMLKMPIRLPKLITENQSLKRQKEEMMTHKEQARLNMLNKAGSEGLADIVRLSSALDVDKSTERMASNAGLIVANNMSDSMAQYMERHSMAWNGRSVLFNEEYKDASKESIYSKGDKMLSSATMCKVTSTAKDERPQNAGEEVNTEMSESVNINYARMISMKTFIQYITQHGALIKNHQYKLNMMLLEPEYKAVSADLEYMITQIKELEQQEANYTLTKPIEKGYWRNCTLTRVTSKGRMFINSVEDILMIKLGLTITFTQLVGLKVAAVDSDLHLLELLMPGLTRDHFLTSEETTMILSVLKPFDGKYKNHKVETMIFVEDWSMLPSTTEEALPALKNPGQDLMAISTHAKPNTMRTLLDNLESIAYYESKLLGTAMWSTMLCGSIIPHAIILSIAKDLNTTADYISTMVMTDLWEKLARMISGHRTSIIMKLCAGEGQITEELNMAVAPKFKFMTGDWKFTVYSSAVFCVYESKLSIITANINDDRLTNDIDDFLAHEIRATAQTEFGYLKFDNNMITNAFSQDVLDMPMLGGVRLTRSGNLLLAESRYCACYYGDIRDLSGSMEVLRRTTGQQMYMSYSLDKSYDELVMRTFSGSGDPPTGAELKVVELWQKLSEDERKDPEVKKLYHHCVFTAKGTVVHRFKPQISKDMWDLYSTNAPNLKLMSGSKVMRSAEHLKKKTEAADVSRKEASPGSDTDNVVDSKSVVHFKNLLSQGNLTILLANIETSTLIDKSREETMTESNQLFCAGYPSEALYSKAILRNVIDLRDAFYLPDNTKFKRFGPLEVLGIGKYTLLKQVNYNDDALIYDEDSDCDEMSDSDDGSSDDSAMGAVVSHPQFADLAAKFLNTENDPSTDDKLAMIGGSNFIGELIKDVDDLEDESFTTSLWIGDACFHLTEEVSATEGIKKISPYTVPALSLFRTVVQDVPPEVKTRLPTYKTHIRLLSNVNTGTTISSDIIELLKMDYQIEQDRMNSLKQTISRLTVLKTRANYAIARDKKRLSHLTKFMAGKLKISSLDSTDRAWLSDLKLRSNDAADFLAAAKAITANISSNKATLTRYKGELNAYEAQSLALNSLATMNSLTTAKQYWDMVKKDARWLGWGKPYGIYLVVLENDLPHAVKWLCDLDQFMECLYKTSFDMALLIGGCQNLLLLDKPLVVDNWLSSMDLSHDDRLLDQDTDDGTYIEGDLDNLELASSESDLEEYSTIFQPQLSSQLTWSEQMEENDKLEGLIDLEIDHMRDTVNHDEMDQADYYNSRLVNLEKDKSLIHKLDATVTNLEDRQLAMSMTPSIAAGASASSDATLMNETSNSEQKKITFNDETDNVMLDNLAGLFD